MSRRCALLALLGLFGLASPRARADVTVLYAPPGPPPPLVASVVPRSEVPTPEPPRAAPRIEPVEPPPRVVSSVEPAPSTSAPRSAPVPEPASADPPIERREIEPAARPSASDRVRVVRLGEEREEIVISLLDAEGRPDPAGLEALSILARPAGTARPSDEAVAAHRDDLGFVADDLRRLHPGLLLRLERIRRAFPGRTIELVSGQRTSGSEHSRHRSGRALDVRVTDVPAAELDALLRSLPETGVGLCPASDLVHLDVRGRSAHWVDLHP